MNDPRKLSQRIASILNSIEPGQIDRDQLDQLRTMRDDLLDVVDRYWQVAQQIDDDTLRESILEMRDDLAPAIVAIDRHLIEQELDELEQDGAR